MNTTNLHSVIVDSLVSYADYFFPEGTYCVQILLFRKLKTLISPKKREMQACVQHLTFRIRRDVLICC